MPKKILSVGALIPGDEIENVNLASRQSLLDADIIVFKAAIPHKDYMQETYNGRIRLGADSSFRSKQALAHWRSELAAAFNAGKLIVVLLAEPEIVFAETGTVTYSGTGRNARGTRHVAELSSYEALPVKWKIHTAAGREMVVRPEARFFAGYWVEFGKVSRYEVYLDGDGLENFLVKTRSGNRIVGAYLRKGRGALVAVPNVGLDEEGFLEEREEDGDVETYWTGKGIAFGRRFAGCLVAMADALASDLTTTPLPNWARDDAYRLSEEIEIEKKIREITEQVASLDYRRTELEATLVRAGLLKDLLFEQGKPLENAVLEALRLMGFEAEGFRDQDSEFDAVFTSPEGRFIGETEGKDNRAINIEKFSQLERNLSEDFARDEVTEFAKGVLFGNAFRLQPLATRGATFTEKCQTAAVRLRAALVRTSDLFAPCRYLKSHPDAEYARQCREAIFMTSGNVVVFPPPPEDGNVGGSEIKVDVLAEDHSN